MPGHKIMKDVNRAIAGRLRMLRQARGMSQGDIADLIGVSFQQIQKYEKGDNRVPIDKLIIIAEALKVSVNYFIEPIEGPTGNHDHGVADTIKSFCADPMGFRMAQAFLRLSVKSRRAAVEIIEGVGSIQPAE